MSHQPLLSRHKLTTSTGRRLAGLKLTGNQQKFCNQINAYYNLTKPGIIYGNALTTAGGYLLASDGHLVITGLLTTLVGLSLIIGAAGVFNNYTDQGIDKKMARTRQRALVSGKIISRQALIYGTLLATIGTAVLIMTTNTLTVGLALFGLFSYIILYGLSKRRSVHGTLIGSISGAMPPVAGYCSVSGHFDIAALIILVTMILWQMPHFYAIAIYRQKDYAAAKIPVLPIVTSIKTTKLHILIYIGLFILVTPLLTLYGYTGYFYFLIMLGISLFWLLRGFYTFNRLTDVIWGRQMFSISLLNIVVFSVLLAIGPLLP